ncbi:hypothetical protein V8Z80_08360 [Orrella sp. JC864]
MTEKQRKELLRLGRKWAMGTASRREILRYLELSGPNNPPRPPLELHRRK